MIAGRVIGAVVATSKAEALKGVKLLAVQTAGKGKAVELVVAGDAIGVAGAGDDVYLVSGREAGIAFGKGRIPMDAGIVGIIDKGTKIPGIEDKCGEE